MNNPWFRLYSEAVDDEKLRLLAFEDRWHFVALLCCKNKGILDSNDELMRRKVAVKLGLDSRELDEVARRLSEVGLIDMETLQPINWDSRQFKTDSSKERTKAYRERMKRHCNVTVTAQDTDTDTDTDTDNIIDTNVSIVSNDESVPDCPHQEIINLYKQKLPSSIHPKTWDGVRCTALKARWREDKKRQNLDWWSSFFEYIEKSDFLTGRVQSKDRKPFELRLDWLVKNENFKKVLDGVYENR